VGAHATISPNRRNERNAEKGRLPFPLFEKLLDVGFDAVGNFAASANARMRDMPFDTLFARGPKRHAMC
jgi:hypothetical protein